MDNYIANIICSMSYEINPKTGVRGALLAADSFPHAVSFTFNNKEEFMKKVSGWLELDAAPVLSADSNGEPKVCVSVIRHNNPECVEDYVFSVAKVPAPWEVQDIFKK